MKLHLRCIAPLETCGSFELHNRRVQRAVLVVRRAEVAQPDVGLIPQPLLEGSGQARLANARLAREQDHLPRT